MNMTSGGVLSEVKSRGISAKHILIPVAVVILCLHIAIIANTVRINQTGELISHAMQGSFAYTQAVKSLQSSSDLLADKARLYVSTGDESYLNGYFAELRGLTQQDAEISSALEPYRVEDADAQLRAAVQAAERRVGMECRAIRLYAEGAQKSLGGYPEAAEAELTAEERALSASEKKQAATALLISADYLQARSLSTDCVDRAVQAVSAVTEQAVEALTATLRQHQRLQWIMTFAIIALLVLSCALLVTLLLIPLARCADQVQQCEPIPSDKGLSEFRRLAIAYDDLLQHRQMTERDLHRKSQTDALTGLPNRLAFENFVSLLSRNHQDSTVVVFSLDVNGLKETNDQEGHAFGDALLRSCAECIRASFGEGDGRQCFRFGGDEFSAFWVDVPLSELDAALERFRQEQAERHVSISLGYAHAEHLRDTTVAALYESADKSMYEDKAEYHRRQAQEVLERLKLITE